MSFTAKDVQALRQATGAGMMDAKRALEETNGDAEAAKRLLRERGLAKSASRDDRASSQGLVARATRDNVAVLLQLQSETDFVAKSDRFKAFGDELAALIAAKGEDAVTERQSELDDLKLLLKEKIGVGRVVRLEAGSGNVLGSYLHSQGERGVNGVLVELAGGSTELAHDIAVHIAFARPKYLSRDEVPGDVVAAERDTLEAQTRNEGKPEAALPKIVEGKLNGFFKEIVLLDQPYAKDDKQSITQFLKGATVVRFAQVEIG